MASVNKVILIGNLGKDPDLRYLPNGDPVCNLSLATNEKWTDKNGDKQESVEWHRVVFFKRHAEVCGEYLKKGASIYVEGKLTTRSWEKDGVTHYMTEIRGDRMVMLGGGKEGPPSANTADQAKRYAEAKGKDAPKGNDQPARGKTGFEDMADDIPF